MGDSNPFRYCGEYYDTETGFIYLRARYYDPSVGRFISKDPHWNVKNMIYGDNPAKDNPTPDMNAIKQSGNLYAYCMDNPVIYKDSNGEFPFLAITGIGGAIIGGIIGGVVAASNDESWWKGALIGAGIGGAAGLGVGAGASVISSLALGGGASATLTFSEIQEGFRYIRQGGMSVAEWGYSLKNSVNQGIQHFFNYAADNTKRLMIIAERLGLKDFKIDKDGFKALTDAARYVIDNYEQIGGLMRDLGGSKFVYYYNEVIIILYDGKIQTVMKGSYQYFWNTK